MYAIRSYYEHQHRVGGERQRRARPGERARDHRDQRHAQIERGVEAGAQTGGVAAGTVGDDHGGEAEALGETHQAFDLLERGAVVVGFARARITSYNVCYTKLLRAWC